MTSDIKTSGKAASKVMSQFSELLANDMFLEAVARLLNERPLHNAADSEIRSYFVANSVEIPPSHKLHWAPSRVARQGHEGKPQPMALTICIYEDDDPLAGGWGFCIVIDMDGIRIEKK
jgi:hypothetical protein